MRSQIKTKNIELDNGNNFAKQVTKKDRDILIN